MDETKDAQRDGPRWEDLEPVERWFARRTGIYPPGYGRVSKKTAAAAPAHSALDVAAKLRAEASGLDLRYLGAYNEMHAAAGLIEQQAHEIAKLRATAAPAPAPACPTPAP